jgi:enoyl-CoA hydratase/carnithine racemase
MEQLVLYEKNNGIGTIILNDPAKMNAFSQPLASALTAALEDMWHDAAVGRWSSAARGAISAPAGT